VLLAVLADSVGQNYFSPQSAGFVMALGIFGLVIAGREPLAMSRAAQLATLAVAGFGLAITHELSPYLAGGALLVLAVYRLANPRWAFAVIIAPAAVWALLHLQAVSKFVTFNSIGSLSNFTPPPVIAARGLVRTPMVAYSADALTLGMLALIALALTGLARNRRRAGAWAFTIASGVGILFIAVNPYGDEGIFRAALFGIPWLTMLGLAAVRKPSWRWPSYGILALVMLACYLVSSFGLDATNVVHPGDVNVLRAYVKDSPPGAYYLEVGGDGDLPSSLNPKQLNMRWDPLWNPKNPHQASVFSVGTPRATDLAALTTSYIAYAHSISHSPPRDLFAVYTPVGAQSSVEYALETMANSRDWLRLFLHSPRWRLVASSEGSYLFRYSPAARRTRGGARGTGLGLGSSPK